MGTVVLDLPKSVRPMPLSDPQFAGVARSDWRKIRSLTFAARLASTPVDTRLERSTRISFA